MLLLLYKFNMCKRSIILPGATICFVAHDGLLVGALALADAVRPEAAEAIQRLQVNLFGCTLRGLILCFRRRQIKSVCLHDAEAAGDLFGCKTFVGGVETFFSRQAFLS